MPIYVIILILAVAAAVIFLKAFLHASPGRVATQLKRLAIYVGVALLIFLAATGRLHWLFALIGSIAAVIPRLLPLLRFLPILQWLQRVGARRPAGSRGNAPPHAAAQTSEVKTRFVNMTLNHDSGELDGEVIDGRFKGQRLSTMSREAIVQLYQECLAHDNESAALIETYLDRIHGDSWRNDQRERTTTAHSHAMSREEALGILGLAENPSREDVLDAHRRLMQKMHPDRGGSSYLAAKINQAKDVLLKG